MSEIKKSKKLLILNVISIILPLIFLIGNILFELFGYGGCIITDGTEDVVLLGMLILMLSMFVTFIVFIVDVIGAFRFWKECRAKALLPLIILIFMATFSVLVSNCIDGVKLGEKRFLRNLDKYEEVVKQIEKMEYNPNEGYGKVSAVGLSNTASVFPEKVDGVIVAEFFVGGIGVLGHYAYIYRSDGLLPASGTDFRRRWRDCNRVNEHWFRCSD
jgi:hypothetical protein